MDIQQVAMSYRDAREAYHKLFRQHFNNQVLPLSERRFWQLQPVFTEEVYRYRFGYGRTNGVEQAARELFRKPLADDFHGRDGQPVLSYTLVEATQFAKTWQDLQRQLYTPLFDVVDGRGDEAYGDLLDALPLAGRSVVEASLAGEYGNNRVFEEAVLEVCLSATMLQLTDLILHGENYVGMSLFDAAMECFAIAGE
jgi:hypothetical protein